MDPKVWGKLLALHRKGNRVDVDALRDRIPFRQDAGKGPKMGSHENRRLRGRKLFWWTLLLIMECLWIYRVEREVGGLPRGLQARGASLGRALRACGALMTLLTSSPSPTCVFWSKKNHRKVLFCLDSVWYSFSVKVKNKEKTGTGIGH